MKTFDEAHMIYVPTIPLSVQMAEENKKINEKFNEFTVNLYAGFDPATALEYFNRVELDTTKVQDHPTTRQYWPRGGVQGCYASHHSLWLKSYQENKTILVLEHDTVPVRKFVDFEFDEFCHLSYPLIAPAFSSAAVDQNVQPHTYVKQGLHMIKGTVGYVIKPKAAKKLLDYSYNVGVGPSDNVCCAESGLNREEMNPPMYTIMSTASMTSNIERFGYKHK